MSLSPALSHAIAENFTGPEQAHLIDLHAYACTRGADCEDGFLRTPGASFNPRCGRLAHILCRDAALHDPVIMGALFLLAATESTDQLIPVDDRFTAELDLAALMSRQLRGEVPIADGSALLGVLIYLLDKVRHLHMVAVLDAAALTEASDFLTRVPRELESATVLKLKAMLTLALAQQRRLLSERV